MGVPLEAVRKRNHDRIAAVLNGFENDLVGVLANIPYEDFDVWLDLVPGGNSRGVPNALGAVYDASLVFLRREIAELGLPYPCEIKDGIAPENTHNEATDDAPDDSKRHLDTYFVDLTPEEVRRCAVVLHFVVFAVMKARDRGSQMDHSPTRGWIADAFLHTTDTSITCYATRIMLELLATDAYIPPYPVLGVVLESALLIPCGNGSTPQSVRQTLAQFVESDEVAAQVVADYVDPTEVGTIERRTFGPSATSRVVQARLAEAALGPEKRAALVELQIWSLCTLFALASAGGFDELTSRRAPSALTAVADLARVPPSPLLLPLKVSIAETLWCVLALQLEDGWPELYALRLGLSAQLAAIHDTRAEQAYVRRLLMAVSMGVPQIGSFLPGMLSIATDAETPECVRMAAGNVMSQLVRDEEISPGALRSQNAYALLVRELARSAAAVTSATTDMEAQIGAGLAEIYVHLFAFWIGESRTPELEHALINSDFFEACADIASPSLRPFLRPRTAAAALEIATAILDSSRIEPLIERGTVSRFVEALHGLVESDLVRLNTAAEMAERLWNGNMDSAYMEFLKHVYHAVLTSPCEWKDKSLRAAFIQLLRHSQTAYDDTLVAVNVALKWVFVSDDDLPENIREKSGNVEQLRTFRANAASLAFELLSEAPDLAPSTVTRLFDAAKAMKIRPAIPLQYYAAQNINGCVTQFLLDSAASPDKASFLLSIDKAALAHASWPTNLRRCTGETALYNDAVPMLLETVIAGALEAIRLEDFSAYSNALAFVLKDTDLFADDKRTELVYNLFAHGERIYYSQPGSDGIRPYLLFLRDITVDWVPLQLVATEAYNKTLVSSCRILRTAFERKDEPTQTLTFSVLSHLAFSGRRMAIPASEATNKEIDLVLDAAVKYDGLRARFTVPIWFGNRDEPGGLMDRWRELFPQVALSDPDAMTNLVRSVSDRDFARNIAAYFAAGNVAVAALHERMDEKLLALVAAIVSRLQFPWISFENMSWSGASETLELVKAQFKRDRDAAAYLFGPLAVLLEHAMCFTLLDSHEKGLSSEQQINSSSRSALNMLDIDSLELVNVMKQKLQELQLSTLDEADGSDESTHNIISGIAWLLVRLIDSRPSATQHIMDSGLFEVLVQCTSSNFRRREKSEASTDDQDTDDVPVVEDDPRRGSFKTANSTVVHVMERCLRVVAHAISTAGVAGERKVIMLVDTPRVVGFDQIENIDDAKSLILRRPELRHAAVEHVMRTSKGLVPASDVPNFKTQVPSLDPLTLHNVSAMISILVPEFLGDDLRKAEVTGDAIVDLLSSLGSTRDLLFEQYPDIVMQVVRRFAPKQVPPDTRFGGDLRNSHILGTSVRFLAALTVQGLDEPFSFTVRESLLRSTEKMLMGLVRYMQTDIKSDIDAGYLDKAAFQMHFISNVLLTASVDQNRLELTVWSQVDPDDALPPFVKVFNTCNIFTVFLEMYALLDPSELPVRSFRVEIFSVLEEYTDLEGYDWSHKTDTPATQDDESDDNDAQTESTSARSQRLSEQRSSERDIFRNSVLGDIDDENAEDEFMDVEDGDEVASEIGLSEDEHYEDDLSDDDRSDVTDDRMSFDESDEGSSNVEDYNDQMSIVRLGSDDLDDSSSDDNVYLLGASEDEDDSDAPATPEVIETVFSSEEGDHIDSASEDASDSELDDFDPENPDADTELPSDVDFVVEGFQPITGFELMNGVLLRFSNELEMLDEPDLDEPDAVQPYAYSALSTPDFPQYTDEPSVLSESGMFLAWWNESTLESSEIFDQIDSFFKHEASRVTGADDSSAIASVRHRQKNVEPPIRGFGMKRDLNIMGISAVTVRMLFTTVLDQDRVDLREVTLHILQYRDGRDAVMGLVMNALFDAADGIIKPAYKKLCDILRAPARLPREATPALICTNTVGLLCDIYEMAPGHSSKERDHHDRTCRRLSRALLRNYGPRLVELLAKPQICQNRKLLHSSAVLVLHILSIMGTRRLDSSTETMSQLAQVLGLRECTSEAFSTLTEIAQKHLRTDALLPHVIRETRRARSSLLVLLPAVAKPAVSPETVDAFATEQVKLLRLMSLLNRIYEPQQVLAALKSVNLLPLWHSVGSRLNNGTLNGPTNGRGFASGVSLLESFALALTAAIKWKPPVPDVHPALTKYALWIRSYINSFMGQRRVLINELLRARPNLYLGPMGEMARALNLFDFQSKEKWLRAKLKEDAESVRAETSTELRFTVSRRHVLEDSFTAFQNLDTLSLRAPMFVKFEKEEAVDAGGVSREWLELMAREILNPAYALFTPTQEGSSIYQVNRDSGVNPNHLEYFRVVGRVLGRAVYDGRMVGLYFSRVIYKYLLGRPNVTLADMEAVDEQYYKSLVWMLEMDVTDVIEETFSIEVTQFGRTITVDLIENGRNIPVTENNKQDYVKRVVEYKLVESVEAQLEALRKGFNDVIAPDLVELFDEQELELLLCGLPTINVEDWRAHTTYVGYSSNSPQIRWFWTAVASFSTEERAKLLQFSTGTSRVPVHGFAHLESSNAAGVQFQIHKEHGSTNRWPSSHTCMNQINLPAYESYKKLRTMLQRASTEGSEGFGFV